MKYALLLLAGLALSSLQACDKHRTPKPEEACHFQQNSYLQRVSWAKLPVTLNAHVSLSQEQLQALYEAVQIWNDVRMAEWGRPEGFFKISPHAFTSAPFVADGHVVVSASSDWPISAREQAETVVRWAGPNITDADIRLNINKPLSVSDPIEPGAIDLVALYVHELGHVLGLLHIDSHEYTIMESTLERGINNRRTPGKLELDALRCEY